MRRAIASAAADLRAGLKHSALWLALAREDIGDQHRRTALGPVWLLLNYLAFAGTFIFVFHGAATPEYPAYVATGLMVWFFVMETLTLGVGLFEREQSFIRGTPLPLSVYVFRLATQSTLRAGYTLAGCIAIVVAAGTPVTPGWIWVLPGLVLMLAAAPAAILCCAFLGAYFPDSQFVVANLMRVGMFLTPVFWERGGEGGLRDAFYAFNPFTYFLEAVRVPIMSGGAPLGALSICAIMTVVLWGVALPVLGFCRREVAFVL